MAQRRTKPAPPKAKRTAALSKAKAGDPLRLEYLALSKIRRFDRNPKKHDVDALVESITRYGFRDAPIFDGTLKSIVAGHGRLEALECIRDEGGRPPRGVIAGPRGEWLVPVQLGVDAASAAEAESFLIDHNALTLGGADLGLDAVVKLFDPDELDALLVDLEKSMPVSLDVEGLEGILHPVYPEGKSYDESAADQVKVLICPKCSHRWPA